MGKGAFQLATTFEVSNLPSIQSIDIGSDCFGGYYQSGIRWEGGASSFSLTGINMWFKWRIDYPQLESVKVGYGAFQNARSFIMSNLTSLQTIETDSFSFGGVSLLSLIGMNDGMKWRIDFPQLQSVKLSGFDSASFTMSNLPALQSIEISGFGGAELVSFMGRISELKWNTDLPQLQSIKLGGAFGGDSSRKTIDEYPYNYNNTLIMKSRNDWWKENNRSSIANIVHWKWRRLYEYRFRDSGE